MKINYTLLRPDLDIWHSEECDSYKFETHPITGRYNLQLYEQRGTATMLTSALSGVVSFHIERPR